MTPDAADLAAIREHHAADDAEKPGLREQWSARAVRMHADRGALLAALDAAHRETLEQAARHADCCVDRQDLAQAQAALDRLAERVERLEDQVAREWLRAGVTTSYDEGRALLMERAP